MAMTKGVGLTLAAAAFGIVAYICLVRTAYIQTLALRWRDLHEPSWELAFLRSPAYLWMIRFVGLVAGANALIALWVLYRIVTR